MELVHIRVGCDCVLLCGCGGRLRLPLLGFVDCYLCIDCFYCYFVCYGFNVLVCLLDWFLVCLV